jgi:cytochrome P450
MLIEEMLAYLFSGAPTSAEYLSWTVSKLAQFPSLQSKLLKEIQNVLHTGRPLGFKGQSVNGNFHLEN